MSDENRKAPSLEYGHRPQVRTLKRRYVLAIGMLAALVGFGWWFKMSFGNLDPTFRTACFVRNMREITVALRQYAADHGGTFPNDLGQLVIGNYVTDPARFICPNSGRKPARGTPSEIAAAITSGKNCDYVYVGMGLRLDDPPDTLLLYEPLGAHDNSWAFIKRLDGTGDQLDAAELQRLTSARSQSAAVKRSEPGKSTDQ